MERYLSILCLLLVGICVVHGSTTTSDEEIYGDTGPVIIVEPEDTVYNEDTSTYVTLDCEAEGTDPLTYTWTVESTELDFSSDDRLTLSGGRLTISNPETSRDAGDYQCQVTNTAGTVMSTVAELTFAYTSDFDQTSRDDITASPSQGVTIVCDPPKAYPGLVYFWIQDELPNFVQTSNRMYIAETTGDLYIAAVEDDDAADYKCVAMNSADDRDQSFAGKVSQGTNLNVESGVKTAQSPSIVYFSDSLTAMEGDSVLLECFAYGYPVPYYEWTKDDGTTITGDVTLEYDGVQLIIDDVQYSDMATYKCTATNDDGDTHTVTIDLIVYASPSFTLELSDDEDLNPDIGDDITLSCEAEGTDTITYSWYKDAVDLGSDSVDRYTVSDNELTITTVEDDDSGMIQCQATNDYGTAISTGQLRVLVIAPVFVDEIEPEMTAAVNGNLTYECNPIAQPTPTYTWYKDGEYLDIDVDDRLSLIDEGDLHIAGVIADDEGEYTCRAENDEGTAESTGTLTVLEGTTISTLSGDITLEVGDTQEFECVASYDSDLDVTYSWMFNDEAISDFDISNYVDSVTYDPDATGVLKVKSVTTDMAGTYTCIAYTTLDQVDDSLEVTVVGPPGTVSGVKASDADTTTAVLRWTTGADNGATITAYYIEALSEFDDDWSRIVEVDPDDDADIQETTLEDLSPYTTYKFRVVAENSYGEGDTSDVSNSVTLSSYWPTTAVENIQDYQGNIGDLAFTWDPLSDSEVNGDGIGYYITYVKSGDTDVIEVTLEGNIGVYQVALSDSEYEPYTAYDITITAYNDFDTSPESAEATVYSSEEEPTEAPTDLEAEGASGSEITVKFTGISAEGVEGTVTGYKVKYWSDGSDEDDATYTAIPGDVDTENKATFDKLESETKYRLRVCAYNSAGNGPESTIALATTLLSAPLTAPENLEAEYAGLDTVDLVWDEVTTGDEEESLSGYKVYYWQYGTSYYSATFFTTSKTSASVNGLTNGERYLFAVKAYSDGGDGPLSDVAMMLMSYSTTGQQGSGASMNVYTSNIAFMFTSLLLPLLVAYTFH